MNEMMRQACALLAMASLPACQSTSDGSTMTLTSAKAPLATMVDVGRAIQKCWMKVPAKGFGGYRMSDETNSYAGRPRVLLVPKSKPTALPALVVQAEKNGGKTQMQVFGPLLSTSKGSLIRVDVARWATGNTGCK